jgi:serine/threonine protein kinase
MTANQQRDNRDKANEPEVPEVSDFDLIRPIGQGGFGRVWLAANRTTGRLRAVKVIPSRGPGMADPAGREIASLTRLEAHLKFQHPNLMTIHHVGQTADCLYYVMDLADDLTGKPASAEAEYRPATLQSRLQDGPLPAEQCLDGARQLLAGLASLHEAAMVHRDVKPANCLFVDGCLKLADFGLLTEAHPQISRMGTQKYMPPDGRMDARADVYAAGLVIYEMITGLPCDRFPHLGATAERLATSPILAALVRLVLTACQPDPKQRFADAGAMLASLTIGDSPAELRPRRTRWRIIAALGATTLGLAAAAAFWTSRPPTVHVNFITVPFEATIYLDQRPLLKQDQTPYRTPCTVEGLPARPHHVLFEHEGFPTRDAGQIDFATTRQVVVRFEGER